MGHPTVYPTGTTIFNKEKTWSGYTVFNVNGKGALLIDMNGNEVHLWRGLDGFPNKILPGGYIFGSRGIRSEKYGIQDQLDLVQLDWNGKVVWEFNKFEYINDPGKESKWMARQHHDYQRQGNPVGYYAPNQEAEILSGNTLILVHKNIYNHNISDKNLLDDVFIEVDWQGNITWRWSFNEHFDELEFDEQARNILFRDPNLRSAGNGMGDWLHINSMSRLGKNKHYDNGDERFHPDNIIWSAREANIIGITSKSSGKIVWKIGPDYRKTHLKHLGWIIGQHHAHMIPKDLPGEGNILIFDNGGWAGYGLPNPSSLYGSKNAWRDYSRVLEIDPINYQIVWQYTAAEEGFAMPMDASRFYSPYVSSAQRLENGNTLITEGSDGRIIEVTKEHEIVWEYISPYWQYGKTKNNMIYRSYRIPYHWINKLSPPEEISILYKDNNKFRITGAGNNTVTGVFVDGIIPREKGESDVLCIASTNESNNKLFEIDFTILKKLDYQNKDSIPKKIEYVFILFGAQRCVNCKYLYQELNNIDSYYVDVDKFEQSTKDFNIKGIPTVILFKLGKEITRFFGAKKSNEIKTLINNSISGQSNENKFK